MIDPKVSLVSEELARDPFPYFEELRLSDHIHWNERHRAWIITSFEAVYAALSDARFTSDRISPYVANRVAPEDRERMEHTFEILGKWMVFKDPPDHTRLRGIVHKAFTPRFVRSLREYTEEIAVELLDRIDADRASDVGSAELIATYCDPLPAEVIARMLGVPAADAPMLKAWAEDLGTIINGALDDPDRNERAHRAVADFESYLDDLVDKERANPDSGSVLSALVVASADAEKLSHDELVAMCMLLLDAGYKTTKNALANAFISLARYPDQYALLRGDNRLIPAAAEELLRYFGPGTLVVRRVRENMDFLGAQMTQGQRVFVISGSANRDAQHFTNPDVLDIKRPGNDHITFGHGIHYCLGAPLARMEIEVGLLRFTERYESYRLDVPEEELEWHRELILHGVKHLPVTMTAVDNGIDRTDQRMVTG